MGRRSNRVNAVVWVLLVLQVHCMAVWGQSVAKKTDRREIGRNPDKADLGTRRAIVIGVDEYTHSKFTALVAAQRDAQDVAKLLTERGWSVRRMTMEDKNRRPVSRDDVLRQVREVYESTKIEDTVLVYFAGHGLGATVAGKRDDFLCVYGTDPDRLGDTAVSVSSLQRLLQVDVPVTEKSHAAKTLLMVDACRDSSRSLSKGFTLDQLRISRGHGVLFATERDATAKEVRGLVDRQGQKVENGLFTHFLLKGLRGDANENGDPYVTFRELSFWIGEQMALLADKHPAANQTPFFTWDGGANHDIALAKAAGARRLQGLTWARRNTQGYEEYTLDKDPSVVMILIPGGTFTMGSTDSDAYDNEKPLTRVTLSSYLIGKHELTWGQYKKFCRESGHAMPESPSFSIDDSHPVVNVSWDDGVAYGKWSGLWRSEEHPGLPTEAEWEYAARGPEGRKWPWGSTSPDSDRNLANHGPGFDRGVWKADGYEYTAPVGSFPRGAGPFGTLDQAGNVWEWCADGSGSYPGGSVTNPTGTRSASPRVIRGGSFDNVARFLRGSSRDWFAPALRGVSLGFRLASQVTP